MIYDTIKSELKQAMMAKDAVRLSVLRGLIAGFTNELVATKQMPSDPVTDELAMAVIRRQVKQRKDSIAQFASGGREDLAEGEKAELAILETFLPTQASDDEIRAVVERKKAELGATDKTKMGQLIGAAVKELGDKADGTRVKTIVEQVLG